MKTILISSFDMEVGGVERSLISMLNNFDYENYNVDLMLFSHTGEFMSSLSQAPSLLKESQAYKTFRMSIGQTLKSGQFLIGFARLLAKYKASLSRGYETGYKQMQYMWKYSLPFLPRLEKHYDVAISYLWPHYFVSDKVSAKIKIAWIHTDYSTVNLNTKMDIRMWDKFNHIIAVSEECKKAFLTKYSQLENKVVVIENITSPEFIRKMSDEKLYNPMVDDYRFKILTVARLSHAKGIDNAVKALKMLKDGGYDDIAWYIVGYGGDEGLIRNLILENDLNGSFILLGKQINPYPFIKACDLYVQPSRYEGKAVTVTEAQILGKPIIITNYNTAKSQVKNGVDGYICPLSIEGLACGIKKLYKDVGLCKQLVNNSRKVDYGNNKELEKLYNLFSKQ